MKSRVCFLGILSLLYLFTTTNVNALTSNVKLTCDNYQLKSEQSTTCEIIGNTQEGGVTSLSANILLTGNLELVDVKTESTWQGNGNNGNIQLYSNKGTKAGDFKIATFVVKVKTNTINSDETLEIKDVKFYDGEENDYKEYSIPAVSKNIRVPSNDNTLSKLNTDIANINFSKDILDYKISVDNSVENIEITASLTDEKASFVEGYGPRKVDLKVGNNEIVIKVKAENGDIKNYTITVTRRKVGETSKDDVNNPSTGDMNFTLIICALAIAGIGGYIGLKKSKE